MDNLTLHTVAATASLTSIFSAHSAFQHLKEGQFKIALKLSAISVASFMVAGYAYTTVRALSETIPETPSILNLNDTKSGLFVVKFLKSPF
jgi:hypothetical protein